MRAETAFAGQPNSLSNAPFRNRVVNPGDDERGPDQVQTVSYGAIAPTAKLNGRRSTEALSPSASFKISLGRQLQKENPVNY